jgi:hypothetical protein
VRFESWKLYTGVIGEGEESMLLLDDLEDEESNRRSGGVLCDETEEKLFEYEP